MWVHVHKAFILLLSQTISAGLGVDGRSRNVLMIIGEVGQEVLAGTRSFLKVHYCPTVSIPCLSVATF
jgi:hypothetical protein